MVTPNILLSTSFSLYILTLSNSKLEGILLFLFKLILKMTNLIPQF